MAFWHFGPLFPTANDFSWVGIDFIQETDHKKPNSTKFSANTLFGDRVLVLVPKYKERFININVQAVLIYRVKVVRCKEISDTPRGASRTAAARAHTYYTPLSDRSDTS